ncbi:MAG: hypothetical protein ACT4OM_00410 [Actinomycetota bacterium]
MEQEKPRPLLFHWIMNTFFAGVALFGGVLFGERIPHDVAQILPVAIPIIGLALIPVTRRWERNGMERRKMEAGSTKKPPGAASAKARAKPKRSPRSGKS